MCGAGYRLKMVGALDDNTQSMAQILHVSEFASGAVKFWKIAVHREKSFCANMLLVITRSPFYMHNCIYYSILLPIIPGLVALD